MNQLPVEVLHLICKDLSAQQAAVLRLVNRTLSQVAAFYMIETVHFHTSEKSFERLKLISDHPVFCQTVKNVYYEAATIEDTGCMHAYLNHFETEPHHAHERPLPLPDSASDRDRRLHNRNVQKFERQIAKLYQRYQDLLQQQQRLLLPTVLQLSISIAITKFVNLKEITFMPLKRCLHFTSSRFHAEFGEDCTIPMAANPEDTPLQLHSLLLPRGGISTNLRSIKINDISPVFFLEPRSADVLNPLFSQLTRIHITIKFYPDDWDEHDDDPCVTFRRYLKNGCLKESLAAAKDLTFLSVGIHYAEQHPMDTLEYIFGDNMWPSLEELELESFIMTDKAFMQLLRRQPKLTKLGAIHLKLNDGSWEDTLSQMREHLDLRTFSTLGFLMDDLDIYRLDLLHEYAYTDGLLFTLSDAICDYVCGDTTAARLTDALTNGNPLAMYDEVFLDEDVLWEDYGPIDQYGDSDMELSLNELLDPFEYSDGFDGDDSDLSPDLSEMEF